MPSSPPLPPIVGIHHITAIAGDPQANLDFHVGVLGLRLIKRTVNFDDPGTWHFYFADHAGSPGSVLTFFPWPHAKQGRHGAGEVRTTAFAVGPDSLGWWSVRFKRLGVAIGEVERRFDEQVLPFTDHDGTNYELVASANHSALPEDSASELPAAHAIRGFHGATLAVAGSEATARLLTDVMGFQAGPSERNRFRFVGNAGEGTPGRIIDLLCIPDAPPARLGAGSVHHIAFRTPDDPSEEVWRARLIAAGQNTTPILDRQYFHSLYFREPGGIIVEFATDPPGFTLDESARELGRSIKLPPWLEGKRAKIEAGLPPVSTPKVRP